LEVKLGKQDCNADFAVTELGLEFINSSFGYPPPIPMPTFPDPTLGVAAFLHPTDWARVQAAVYEGAIHCRVHDISGSGLYFSILEAGVRWELGPRQLPGDLHAGLWYHNGHFPDIALGCPVARSGNHGFYMGFGQVLFEASQSGEEDGRGLGLFSQYAWAPEDRNEAEHYIGVGLRYQGILAHRPEDVCGLGLAKVLFSDLSADQDSETAVELFYRLQLSEWIALQPDLQYIVSPGGNGRDAFVFGLRYEVLL
jgi:porin